MDRPSMQRSNAMVADLLFSVGELLTAQHAGATRVQPWYLGAAAIRGLDRPIAEIVRNEGIDGLDHLLGVGPGIVGAIREIVETGRLATYERLLGESDPVARIASVPGIGRKLAQRIHLALGIESIEELERAAYDGRLLRVAGWGSKRVAGLRAVLASRVRREMPRRESSPASIEEILDVDREYRESAAAGSLPKIAPSRFNPAGERWLPILHCARGDRHYTALYSNTAHAHRLGRTHDWVVLYYDDRDGEHQCTVATAQRGPLEGRRVVRGRESECVMHYHLNSPRTRLLTKSAS